MKKNYRFYLTSDNVVVAVSTYAGKTVKGAAKCAPNDTFSLEDGQALAAARCNYKIASKRLRRADQKLTEAYQAMIEAIDHYEKMSHYYSDSTNAVIGASEELSEVLSKLMP